MTRGVDLATIGEKISNEKRQELLNESQSEHNKVL